MERERTEASVLSYLAGIVDGEGYVGVKRRKPSGRVTPSYVATIQVRMMDDGAIRLLSETLGGWYYQERKPRVAGKRRMFLFQACDASAEAILVALLPHMIVKRRQAEEVVAFRAIQKESVRHKTKIIGYREFRGKRGQTIRVATKTLSDEYVASLHAAYNRCKELNNRPAVPMP